MPRRVFTDGGNKYDKLMQQSEQDDTKIKIQSIYVMVDQMHKKKKKKYKEKRRGGEKGQ